MKKNNKTFEIQLNDVVVVFIIVIAFVLFYFHKKNQNEKLKSYIGDYDLGLGKVEFYWEGISTKTSVGKTSITYSYIINAHKFTKSYDSSFYKVPLEANKEDLYLIIYNKNNPQNSLILEGYPIPSIQDFEKIVKKFKDDSPNIFE